MKKTYFQGHSGSLRLDLNRLKSKSGLDSRFKNLAHTFPGKLESRHKFKTSYIHRFKLKFVQIGLNRDPNSARLCVGTVLRKHPSPD